MRDDFTQATKRLLAARVGHVCSKPDCRAPTSGPGLDNDRAVTSGDAAHITAASPGGARYDASLTSEQRRHHSNGIWLCVNDARIVDQDASRFPVEVLRRWKAEAEKEAKTRLGRPSAAVPTAHPEAYRAAPSKLPKKHDRGVFEGRDGVLKELDDVWADVVTRKPGRAQIVSLVAVGGAGKTTVASRWKDALLAREGHGSVERYFDWSFYSQGTCAEAGSDGIQTAQDATVFVAAALQFFGDSSMADSPAPAWDKGARLAELVSQHRTLLILDGLEPLQHPPGPQEGELKDDAIRALFRGLQNNGRGLCVVTTRESITEFAATHDTTTPEWKLDHLTDAVGAAVLRGHGVIGPQAELEAASREVKGHALTLSLMGRYLKMAFRSAPDITRRDCFHFEKADAEMQNGHAFRVFAAYERWFEGEGRGVEVAILRILGLFDRPATPGCLAALCQAPAIPGLTEPLVNISEQNWEIAISALVELDLVETAEWPSVAVSGYSEVEARRALAAGQQRLNINIGQPRVFSPVQNASYIRHALDAHPLLREFWASQLRQRGSASAGHSRLFEHLCASTPYWPEGRDGLLPLYQAVVHGCRAGRFDEALKHVYISRIKRGTEGFHGHYSSKKLGLFGLDLAALACLFVEPWHHVVAELEPYLQAWVLSDAAVSLSAMNRLSEAREPMRAATEMQVTLENWIEAAGSATNMSQFELALGEVATAGDTAAQAISFGDRSQDTWTRLVNRVTRADALHQAGRFDESRSLFAEAEEIQTQWQPDRPYLYSVQGYQYCDLLLAEIELAVWRRSLQRLNDFSRESRGQPFATTAAERDSETARLNYELATIESRATQTLEWITPQDWLLDPGLDELTLGRVHLFRAILADTHLEVSNPDSLKVRRLVSESLKHLRQAGRSGYLPPVLLTCAWLHAFAREWEAARQRLDEAFAVATRGGRQHNGWRGGMRLHVIDTLLHRARLFGRAKSAHARAVGASLPLAEYPWTGRTPQMDLAEATALIAACGYHRRVHELADAQEAARHW